jgi:hypothetical protein
VEASAAPAHTSEGIDVTEEELDLFCRTRATELILNTGQVNVAYDQVVGVVTVDYQMSDPNFVTCDRIWGLIARAVVTVEYPE